MKNNEDFPERIVCLTEESVETLYWLEKEHLIQGVSAFVKRPAAAQNLPKVSNGHGHFEMVKGFETACSTYTHTV